MLIVLNCIAYEHDLRLVGLAVVVCALATFTAISLLHHMQRSTGKSRLIWLAVSATTTGFGIWATHFIAMLAFSPGMPSGYNVALTSLSLVAAIVLTGVGFAVAVAPNLPASASIGGAIVGGGIAAMHYTGMAAFEVQGHILWDPVLVSASIALGALFGAIALPVGLHRGGIQWKIFGALLLTLAICSHHFTAMGAASLLPDPTIQLSATAVPSGLLAIAVALATFIIVVLGLAGAAIEVRSPAQRTRDRTDARARQCGGRGPRRLRQRDRRNGQQQLCGSRWIDARRYGRHHARAMASRTKDTLTASGAPGSTGRG
jgi:diguanylate cyclase